MRIFIMSLFPDMIMSALSESITGRAISRGSLRVEAVNIRDYTEEKHGRVDDYPYGGGAGMVMQAQPVYDCYRHVRQMAGDDAPVIYMSPQGRTLNQSMAGELAALEDMIILCGHYEGIDQRVIDEIVDREISIGDYVLTGGELPAMVLVDCVSRLLPGVLHNSESALHESFEDGLLEHAQYTRPRVWMGKEVPEILLSGDHARVDEYRYRESLERTRALRPDLIGEN